MVRIKKIYQYILRGFNIVFVASSYTVILKRDRHTKLTVNAG